MRVEAQYRDGHKEQLLVTEHATLAKVVQLARETYPRSDVKFVKVIDHANHRGG